MNILFVWTGLTSYMGDCWRRLAAEADVELKVVVSVREQDGTAFQAADVLRGLDYKIVGCDGDCNDEVVAWKPDVIFAVGWRNPVCRAIVEDGRLASVPKVCCFDMPWRWQLRCLVAPLVLGRFLRRYRAAFVPGAVCARYAKWLGFKSVHKGLFAIDTTRFATGNQQPAIGNQQPYFLYIGRNSSEKRLDDLRRAHALYRANGGRLDLRMYGKGLESGFAKPDDVPSLMHGAAAFVLASDFDPWPLVLLEAMSAGCPVIASDRCTNRPELGKNWRVFKTGDVQALALAMGEKGESGERVREREENLALARQYDCAEWVGRVRRIIKEVTA